MPSIFKKISNFFSGGERSRIKPSDIGEPTHYKHLSHIGFNQQTGTFDVRNVPPEYKAMFGKAGISDRDLKDPKLASFIAKFVEEQEKKGGEVIGLKGSTPPPVPPRPGKRNKKAQSYNNPLNNDEMSNLPKSMPRAQSERVQVMPTVVINQRKEHNAATVATLLNIKNTHPIPQIVITSPKISVATVPPPTQTRAQQQTTAPPPPPPPPTSKKQKQQTVDSDEEDESTVKTKGSSSLPKNGGVGGDGDGDGDDARSALMTSIRNAPKKSKLRKVQTNDRSAPLASMQQNQGQAAKVALGSDDPRDALLASIRGVSKDTLKKVTPVASKAVELGAGVAAVGAAGGDLMAQMLAKALADRKKRIASGEDSD